MAGSSFEPRGGVPHRNVYLHQKHAILLGIVDARRNDPVQTGSESTTIRRLEALGTPDTGFPSSKRTRSAVLRIMLRMVRLPNAPLGVGGERSLHRLLGVEHRQTHRLPNDPPGVQRAFQLINGVVRAVPEDLPARIHHFWFSFIVDVACDSTSKKKSSETAVMVSLSSIGRIRTVEGSPSVLANGMRTITFGLFRVGTFRAVE